MSSNVCVCVWGGGVCMCVFHILLSSDKSRIRFLWQGRLLKTIKEYTKHTIDLVNPLKNRSLISFRPLTEFSGTHFQTL